MAPAGIEHTNLRSLKRLARGPSLDEIAIEFVHKEDSRSIIDLPEGRDQGTSTGKKEGSGNRHQSFPSFQGPRATLACGEHDHSRI